MIFQLQSFDYLTASPSRLMSSAGFWTSLPRLTQSGTARLLMVADTLHAETVRAGFEAVASPLEHLPPGVLAYRNEYDDFLSSMVRDVRYLRLYLVLDGVLSAEQVIGVLGGYGVRAQPLDHAMPRPFAQGRDRWNFVESSTGLWAMLRSKDRQGGVLTPRSLHALLGVDFPVYAALHVYTFPQSRVLRLLREKSALVGADSGKRLEESAAVQEAAGGILGIRQALSQGLGLHTLRLYVMVGAPDEAALNGRLEIVRSALPLETIRLFGAGETMRKVFSAEPLHEREGFMLTTEGATMLAGSALSYRRRTEVHGVMLGIDRNQAPVILDIFDERNPSYNTVVLGQTGSGKTFAVLLLMLRHLLMGVRLVIVDPQGNVDLSFLGEEVYRRSVLGTEQASINVLDIVHDDIPAQVETAKSMLRLLGVYEASGLDDAVLDEALTGLYRAVWDARTSPLLVDLLHRLEALAEDGRGQAVRETAARLAYRLTPFVSGSKAAWFGQPTTMDFGLEHAVNVFDVSRLPSREAGGGMRAALLSILVGNINRGIRRRRSAGDTAPILFFVDEMGVLMRDHVMASYISSEYKTARARLVGMIVADQDLHSFLGPQDESGLHHGVPMLANAANVLLFNQKDSELARIREHFPTLPEEIVQSLPILPRGTCAAQFPDDLLMVNVVPSRLDRVVLSSRLQDRERARQVVAQLRAEMGLED